MLQNKYALAINSTLILVSTTIFSTILHESAHYLTGLFFHLKPVLHHNYVESLRVGTEGQMVIEAAAGPLFSLVFGVLMMLFSIKCIRPSLLKLFFTWLGMGNILIFMGYILIAPIAKQGDTGKVFAYFNSPMYLTITAAVLSFIFINYLFGKWSSQFVFYNSENNYNKRNLKLQLFVIPVLLSIVIVTILSLPVIIWISLLPTIFMPMSYFRIMGAYLQQNEIQPTVNIQKVSPILLLFTLVTVLLFRYLV
jgi:hypothetical protein